MEPQSLGEQDLGVGRLEGLEAFDPVVSLFVRGLRLEERLDADLGQELRERRRPLADGRLGGLVGLVRQGDDEPDEVGVVRFPGAADVVEAKASRHDKVPRERTRPTGRLIPSGKNGRSEAGCRPLPVSPPSSSREGHLPRDLGHRRLSGPPPGDEQVVDRNPGRRGCPRPGRQPARPPGIAGLKQPSLGCMRCRTLGRRNAAPVQSTKLDLSSQNATTAIENSPLVHHRHGACKTPPKMRVDRTHHGVHPPIDSRCRATAHRREAGWLRAQPAGRTIPPPPDATRPARPGR